MTRAPRKKPADDGFDGEDLTAAEYALGVLDADERAAAEARAETDPAFAEDILYWVNRFAPLMELVPPQEPSPALWGRIQSAVARRKSASGTETAEPAPIPIPIPQAANEDTPQPSAPGLWRAWAVAASAIAAVALLFIGVRLVPGGLPTPGPAGRGPTLVARLSLKQSGAGVVTIAYDPQRATLYASPDADFSIPKARAAELWLIPADGKPRAMGAIDPDKPASMPMPPAFRTLAKAGAKIALSIEPQNASLDAGPTGPVIADGGFEQI